MFRSLIGAIRRRPPGGNHLDHIRHRLEIAKRRFAVEPKVRPAVRLVVACRLFGDTLAHSF
jgi:hypothetical protein